LCYNLRSHADDGDEKMAQSTRKRTPKPRRQQQQQPKQTPEIETTADKLFALRDTFQAIANRSWDILHVDLFRGHSNPKVELDESLWDEIVHPYPPQDHWRSEYIDLHPVLNGSWCLGYWLEDECDHNLSRPVVEQAKLAGSLIGHWSDGRGSETIINSCDLWCYAVHSVFLRDPLGRLAYHRDPLPDYEFTDDDNKSYKVEITQYRIQLGIAQLSVDAIERLMQYPPLKKFHGRKGGAKFKRVDWQACYALRDGKMRTGDEIATEMGRPYNDGHLRGVLARLGASGLVDNENDHDGYRLNDRGRWALVLAE
jgi:hypothetical protein